LHTTFFGFGVVDAFTFDHAVVMAGRIGIAVEPSLTSGDGFLPAQPVEGQQKRRKKNWDPVLRWLSICWMCVM
jgi:hypothetical protein